MATTRKKVLSGCGIGCVGLFALAAVFGFLSYRFVKGKFDEFTGEFEAKGWKQQMGQVVVVNTSPAEETYYVGQSVTVSGDVDKEIGIIAQIAELRGTFEERVYFRGQSILITPQAHLKKGLDVQCQLVDQQGTVDGGITGGYQSMSGSSTGTAIERAIEEIPAIE